MAHLMRLPPSGRPDDDLDTIDLAPDMLIAWGPGRAAIARVRDWDPLLRVADLEPYVRSRGPDRLRPDMEWPNQVWTFKPSGLEAQHHLSSNWSQIELTTRGTLTALAVKEIRRALRQA